MSVFSCPGTAGHRASRVSQASPEPSGVVRAFDRHVPGDVSVQRRVVSLLEGDGGVTVSQQAIEHHRLDGAHRASHPGLTSTGHLGRDAKCSILRTIVAARSGPTRPQQLGRMNRYASLCVDPWADRRARCWVPVVTMTTVARAGRPTPSPSRSRPSPVRSTRRRPSTVRPGVSPRTSTSG